jgi:hypothetical protein
MDTPFTVGEDLTVEEKESKRRETGDFQRG